MQINERNPSKKPAICIQNNRAINYIICFKRSFCETSVNFCCFISVLVIENFAGSYIFFIEKPMA